MLKEEQGGNYGSKNRRERRIIDEVRYTTESQSGQSDDLTELWPLCRVRWEAAGRGGVKERHDLSCVTVSL